jgi:chloride channel protein, CIC family
MTGPQGPAGAPEPDQGSPAAAAERPADIDPVAVIRSKRYLSALILASILGIPISAVAYGFLALVAAKKHLRNGHVPPISEPALPAK